MKIEGAVALVTGANRGLGVAYAKALLAAGAAKVYAGARDPARVTYDGVVPVRLDVTNAAEVEAAATRCSDVTLVVNNAGIFEPKTPLTADGGIEALRALLDVNLYGMLAVSRAFAPVLARNGGGALVNMLSALSFASLSTTAAYSVSKAAAWALTNGLRNELRAQGTQVLAVHAGYIDTDMAAGATGFKSKPEDIANAVIGALIAGESELLADQTAQRTKAGFSATPPVYTQAIG